MVDVSGTPVSGATDLNSGSEHINGAIATLADDVTSINAATQNALTLPNDYKNSKAGFWGPIVKTGQSAGGF